MPRTDESSRGHSHIHGPGCGHTAVRHKDHVDYLDRHLHHVNGEHIEEHVIEVSEMNPDRCSPEHRDKLEEKLGLSWPKLLDFWGLPNLQVINRVVHAAKCANEAQDRRAQRPIETEPA
jgi:hypothetical protein